VPLRATDCVCSVSVTVSDPPTTPLLAGVKVTLRVQELCAASEIPQPLLNAKTAGEAVMLVIASGTSPELVSVTACAALVVFTACDENVSDMGASASVADA